MVKFRETLKGNPLSGLPHKISEDLIGARKHSVWHMIGVWLVFIIMIAGFAIGGFWLWPYLESLATQNAMKKATELEAILFQTHFGLGLFIGLFVWIFLTLPLSNWIVKIAPMPIKGALFLGLFTEKDNTGSKLKKTINSTLEKNGSPKNNAQLINDIVNQAIKKYLILAIPLILITAFITYKEMQSYSVYSETDYYHAGIFSKKSTSWDQAIFAELGCNYVAGHGAADEFVYKIFFKDGRSTNIGDAQHLSGTWMQHAMTLNAKLIDRNVSFRRWKWLRRDPLHPACLNAQRRNHRTKHLENFTSLFRIGAFESDLETSTGLHAISAISKSLGSHKKAEDLLLKALAKNEAEFGSDHASTAISLDRLGSIYFTQKKYLQAQAFHQRALTIRKTELGETDSLTAASINKLALTYQKLGDYETSENLYQQALKIDELVHLDNPNRAAMTLSNLGAFYHEQAQYSKAEAFYLRALDMRQKPVGQGGLKLATALNQLGSLYEDQAVYDKAEPLLLRALTIKEEVVGLDHTSTANSLDRLGSLYKNIGDKAQAKSFYTRALKVRELIQGHDHPQTLETINNLNKVSK